jgi:DNA processing protein
LFSTEKLGMIAYLNDNARATLNRSLQRLTAEAVDQVLDTYLSGGMAAENNDDLQTLRMLYERPIGKELQARTTSRIQDYLKKGIRIITFWDPTYPSNLRSIPNPPLLLYVNGRVFPGNNPVGIVGTTNPSDRGLELAYQFGAAMAKKRRAVVSGLAKGIDTYAHGGALSVKGTTIAVLSTPITEIYPEENKHLSEEITQGGAIVSEITEEADTHPRRVIQRNRIISGMSESVVVIESSGEGVAHRQVEIALNQGRKVYVVDHDVFTNPEHKAGFVKLKEMGALPISVPEEMASTEPKQLKLFD